LTSTDDTATQTIPRLIAGAADRHGDRLAIVDGGTPLTYGDLLDASRSFGAALVASGVERGDRVGIWAPNGDRWVVAALGVVQAGGVLVPVNTRFKGPEAADILARSRASALVTVTDFLGTDYVAMLDAAGTTLPHLRTIVVAHGPAPAGAESWGRFTDRADDATRAEVGRRTAAIGGGDPADILFTSGTTGAPKGVVQTHGRTCRVATDWVEMTGLTATDRYLMVNPYFHMFGLKAGILASIAAGATMLPQAVFDVDRVLARIAEERVTVLPGPPTLYQSLLDHPARDDHDLSTLRVAVTGAADIPVELIRRLHDELPFSTIITGYGLTEAGTATATSPGDDVETIATTVGRPRPGFELRIVDDRQQPVATGTSGEILLRGGSVMSHYVDDADATAEALSTDGWLRTGDLGVVEPTGHLRIVGRVKDMFIVGGFNAYPAEIENVLLRHAGVQQVAVIGIPDARLGEVGKAFVVARPGAAMTAAELIQWSRGQMANYKVPREIELVDALPLNATGKVMKDLLKTFVSPDPTVEVGSGDRNRRTQPPGVGEHP
jgi:acyl-CoA synthetase (AMP-forming)/AMP-acid ligase II